MGPKMFRPELSTATRSEDGAYISITFRVPPKRYGDFWNRLRRFGESLQGSHGDVRRQIVMICSEYAHHHGWEGLLRTLFREIARTAGPNAAQRLLGALATKTYAKKERDEEVVFMYETMDQPSVSEIVDLLIDVNRLLPHERRLGSRTIIPGAMTKYVNEVLKRHRRVASK